MKKQNLEDTKINITQLSELIGLSPKRIRTLTSNGEFHRDSEGRYNLADTVQAYVRFKADGGRNAEIDTKLKQARIDKLALERAEKESELVSKNDAELAIDISIAAVRAGFQDLPEKYTRDPIQRNQLSKIIQDVMEGIDSKASLAKNFLRTGELSDSI